MRLDAVSLDVVRAAALEGVAARLPRAARRRVDGRGRRAQRGLGSGDDRDADRRESRARPSTAVLPGAPARDSVYQIHSPTAVIVTERLARGRAAAGRRAGHRPAGPAARHPHRRLRAGAAGRRRGGRGRRGPCRLARRAGRRDRPGDRGDGHAGRHGASGSPRRSARASPRASYEVDHAFPTPCSPTTPTMSASSPTGRGGKPHFDLEAYVVARLAAAGIGGSRRWPSTPMPLATASTATAARPIAASQLTGGR